MSLGVVDPQMNKFEQVSSDHHQMLHAGQGGALSCDLSHDAFETYGQTESYIFRRKDYFN